MGTTYAHDGAGMELFDEEGRDALRAAERALVRAGWDVVGRCDVAISSALCADVLVVTWALGRGDAVGGASLVAAVGLTVLVADRALRLRRAATRLLRG